MDIIKGVIDKVASRKLAVTAAAATGTVELTLAYGGGSGGLYRRADGGVDTWGE